MVPFICWDSLWSWAACWPTHPWTSAAFNCCSTTSTTSWPTWRRTPALSLWSKTIAWHLQNITEELCDTEVFTKNLFSIPLQLNVQKCIFLGMNSYSSLSLFEVCEVKFWIFLKIAWQMRTSATCAPQLLALASPDYLHMEHWSVQKSLLLRSILLRLYSQNLQLCKSW